MATRRLNNLPRSAFTAEQKIAFALLLFLSLGGIFFGFRSFGANLYRPIQQQFAKFYTGEDVVNPNAKEEQEREEQKKKDTDGDGLSDYDELYVYQTSPYLADSDSDSFDDKTEVYSNNDPNCPKEKTCDGVNHPEDSNTQNTTASDILDTFSGDQKAVFDAGKVSFKSKADIEAFFKSATMAEVRAALVESGTVTKEAVEKMTDDELKKLFEQALFQASTTGALDSLINEKKKP